jgi:hypothetical protein
MTAAGDTSEIADYLRLTLEPLYRRTCTQIFQLCHFQWLRRESSPARQTGIWYRAGRGHYLCIMHVRVVQIYVGVLAGLTCTDRSHGLKWALLANRCE